MGLKWKNFSFPFEKDSCGVLMLDRLRRQLIHLLDYWEHIRTDVIILTQSSLKGMEREI